MSRLDIVRTTQVQNVVDGLYRDLERRIVSSPPGLCPIDLSLAFLKLCQVQTCGKCVPCRVGLQQLENLLESVLDGKADLNTIDWIEKTARIITITADCAIGYEAARMVHKSVTSFKSDYIEHVKKNRCIGSFEAPVPCVALCPAGVEVPGYIALISAGRYDDAVKLIRKDNPFPTTCAYICEHPCEDRCRRNMIDSSINICGLKRFAVDNAGTVPAPASAETTDKSVAIIGGGPGGLTAAYFLKLMGHKVTVFEKREKLGGMLRYGIPAYRLPRERLDDDIKCVLSTGVEVKTNFEVGRDISYKELRDQFDAIYISIGAHTDKKARIPGEDSKGVISAVDMLRGIGDNNMPDFTGKRVVVIGGGNVAMDVTRTSVRLGAEKVSCVYRRRQEDMTALPEEVEGAIAEGAELITLQAPAKIETDENGNVKALWAQPQMIGKMDASGRPSPQKANRDEVSIPADIIIIAIGQNIESNHFAENGIPVKWGAIQALTSCEIADHPGVFSGGDCVTGPATVIKAIAAGKIAAANIDEYLGFHHEISSDIDIPIAQNEDRPPMGRVNVEGREASVRKDDFECIDIGMSCEGACQESNRCLRCDSFGFGSFRGGNIKKW